MKVIAIQSSGDQTSVSIINNDDILSYSLDHERKDRPDWNDMLQNIGLNTNFSFADIDLFAYAKRSMSARAKLEFNPRLDSILFQSGLSFLSWSKE